MRFIIILLLLISINGLGQWKNYILSVRGDTLNRVDMQGRKQGPWVIHVDELRGEQGYDEQGYFENDKKDGLWVKFSLMGDKIAEENYRWGQLDGKCKYYTRTGGLEHVESWRAIDPSKDMDTVNVYDVNDPSKVIDRVVVKSNGHSMKHGVWTYYDPEWGGILKTERYFVDKLQIAEGEGGDDDIQPLNVSNGINTDSLGNKTIKKPQVILDYEKKNAGKKKIKVRDGSTGQLPHP